MEDASQFTNESQETAPPLSAQSSMMQDAEPAAETQYLSEEARYEAQVANVTQSVLGATSALQRAFEEAVLQGRVQDAEHLHSLLHVTTYANANPDGARGISEVVRAAALDEGHKRKFDDTVVRRAAGAADDNQMDDDDANAAEASREDSDVQRALLLSLQNEEEDFDRIMKAAVKESEVAAATDDTWRALEGFGNMESSKPVTEPLAQHQEIFDHVRPVKRRANPFGGVDSNIPLSPGAASPHTFGSPAPTAATAIPQFSPGAPGFTPPSMVPSATTTTTAPSSFSYTPAVGPAPFGSIPPGASAFGAQPQPPHA
eukprot:TRINITY_DN7151_c0_g1_i1.p1 TRINITY_DN7151_c0_g1~~TRINITY_DN7151_c0_g1_i1.p1  ORF type:complete len:358 (+),score=61.65 TRINITY_DN7151_c0_g1_i1:128-1075(+)